MNNHEHYREQRRKRGTCAPATLRRMNKKIHELSKEQVALAFERVEAGEHIYAVAIDFGVKPGKLGHILAQARERGFSAFAEVAAQ